MRRMLQGLTLPRGKPHPLVGAVVDLSLCRETNFLASEFC